MAAQPANTDIQVYMRVRAQRHLLRHESVEAITKRLRPLVMSVPNKEILTEVKARDTSKRDFSNWGRDGQPIVIGPRKFVKFADAQENMAGVDFAIQIGGDMFINNTKANLSSKDLQNDLRGITASLA